jgi:hypothetical protein
MSLGNDVPPSPPHGDSSVLKKHQGHSEVPAEDPPPQVLLLSPAHLATVSPTCVVHSVDTAGEWVLGDDAAWVWGREASGVSPPQVASMNQRRVDFYLASIEDMLVAVGGRNENGALSSVETYSPKTDSWSYVAGLPR